MKSLSKMLVVFAVVGLGGFTIVNNVTGTSDIPVLTEEFVPVADNIIENTTSIQYINRGTMRASWYGPRFHGKTTANGEIYDQTALTAAHKSLRFGTILKVTNPRNNKSVIVRINDRGPYIPGRQLDLSKSAAEQLGLIFSGVRRLKVEEVVITGVDNPIVTVN